MRAADAKTHLVVARQNASPLSYTAVAMAAACGRADGKQLNRVTNGEAHLVTDRPNSSQAPLVVLGLQEEIYPY